MTITEVKFRRFINEGKLRAVVSLTFDGSFAVHDIKIVQGEERLFVAMPSRRDDNGVFRDIVHPIDSKLRNEIAVSSRCCRYLSRFFCLLVLPFKIPPYILQA